MTHNELKNKLLLALERIEKQAKEQPACTSGRGMRSGLEYAHYEIECAIDKRKRKDMNKPY